MAGAIPSSNYTLLVARCRRDERRERRLIEDHASLQHQAERKTGPRTSFTQLCKGEKPEQSRSAILSLRAREPARRNGRIMHEDDLNTEATQERTGRPPRPWYGRLARTRAAWFAVAALGIGGLLAGQALAQGGIGFGHPCGTLGSHHSLSDEDLSAQVDEHLEFVLARLNVNDGQKAAFRSRLALLEPELLEARHAHCTRRRHRPHRGARDGGGGLSPEAVQSA